MGFVILVISVLLFIQAIDRMDWWDQADKEYERECLPNNNPQPDADLCAELQNEANSRMRIFSVVLFSSIVHGKRRASVRDRNVLLFVFVIGNHVCLQ